MRSALRRDWLCEDERTRGGCSDEHGPEGSCPGCPLHRLDAEMQGPLGAAIHRAFQLVRRKNAGFLLVSEDLPADVVLAVQIVHEEQQAYLDEKRGHEEETAAVQRELKKAEKRGG